MRLKLQPPPQRPTRIEAAEDLSPLDLLERYAEATGMKEQVLQRAQQVIQVSTS